MKQEVRRLLAARRDEIALPARRDAAQKVARSILEWSAYRRARSVLVYLAVGSELSVDAVLEAAWSSGRRVGVPLMGADRFDAVEVEPGALFAPGAYGIREPVAPGPARAQWDLVLVPGLGFDDRGHRVGYGKGYYDRFLARADAGVTAGVTYEQCLVPRMPDQPHDHPVGWVVTPDRRIRAQTEHVQ